MLGGRNTLTARCLNYTTVLLSVVMMVVYVTFELLIWFQPFDDERSQLIKHYHLNLTFYSILLVSYTISFLFLCTNTLKLSKEHFNKEINSVNCQFALFLTAYSTRMVYYILRLSKPDIFDNFQAVIFDSVIEIVWDILPISYVLYSNYMVYRRVPNIKLKQKLLATPESSSE